MPAPRPLRAARRALAACAALGLAQIGAIPAQASEGRALQLEVFVNGTSTQLVGAFIEQPDGQLAATHKELKEVGLKPPAGSEDDLVVLDQLPGLVYRYDEPRQRLDVTVPDESRMPHVVDARGEAPPAGKPQAGFGGVLNYVLHGAGSQGAASDPILSSASAQIDARLLTPFGYLQQTGILGTALTRDVNALRLDTTFVASDPETATTYRAGDIISRGPLWARPIRMGGLQIERNFALRPDLVTAPLPSVAGSAAVPSTVDVFVDNLRTFSRDIPAGPYSITNLPTLSGAGTARVVLRDAAGRTVETSLPFFTAPHLLRQGLLDFSVQAGLPRMSYAVESNAYAAQPVGSLSARYGLTDWLTLEAHGEGAAGLYNGGAGIITNAGGFGVLSLAGRASSFEGAQGFQAYAAFETRLLGFTVSLSSQRNIGAFEDLASITSRLSKFDALSWQGSTVLDGFAPQTGTRNLHPPRAVDRVSLGVPAFDRASIGLSFVNVERELGDHSQLAAISYSQTFGLGIAASVNAFADLSNRKDAGIFVGLSMPLGEVGQASLGGTSNRSGAYLTADASRPLGLQPGDYGWRVRHLEGRDQSYSTAAASYRSQIGRVEVVAEQFGRGGRVSAEAEGGIAVTGAGLFLSGRIDDAFAVVDVGAPNVEVFHDNRFVGRTGLGGQLLVPDLRSFQPSRIAIDPSSLPLDAHIAGTSEVVVPAEKAGVRLDFGVRAHDDAAVVILQDGEGKPLRPGSRIRLEGGSEPFVVGYDGRAFLRQLKTSNSVIVESGAGECLANFDFSPRPGEQVVIGPVLCL